MRSVAIIILLSLVASCTGGAGHFAQPPTDAGHGRVLTARSVALARLGTPRLPVTHPSIAFVPGARSGSGVLRADGSPTKVDVARIARAWGTKVANYFT